MNGKGQIDTRGYAGGERNRALDPKDVIWARAAYARGEVNAVGLSRMWGLGVESVRRMLRGETYQNVGEALPRAKAVAEDFRRDEPSEEFLRQIALGDGGGEAEGGPQGNGGGGEEAVDAFLRGGK